jgi:hypothetical protein
VIEWLSDYHLARPDPEKLQGIVDRFMEAFDARTAEVLLHSFIHSFIHSFKPYYCGYCQLTD